MEQEVSSFGDYRLERAVRFIHDRLVSHGPEGISIRRRGNCAGEILRIRSRLRSGRSYPRKSMEPSTRKKYAGYAH